MLVFKSVQTPASVPAQWMSGAVHVDESDFASPVGPPSGGSDPSCDDASTPASSETVATAHAAAADAQKSPKNKTRACFISVNDITLSAQAIDEQQPARREKNGDARADGADERADARPERRRNEQLHERRQAEDRVSDRHDDHVVTAVRIHELHVRRLAGYVRRVPTEHRDEAREQNGSDQDDQGRSADFLRRRFRGHASRLAEARSFLDR